MRIQHPALSALPGIAHGFFTRNGGTSPAPYESLNCGFGSDEPRERVEKNRTLVATTMGVEHDRLINAYQVHSADAIIADAPFPANEIPKADAVVTATRGLAVAVLTADCGPILMADPEAGVVAAAHAGWRGAFDGIIESTLNVMERLGARKERITAILGPTISLANYEVDQAFKERFLDRDPATHIFFAAGKRDGHVQFDLPSFILSRLEAASVGQAINMDRCTYAEEDAFFSYRRSTHRNEPDYGRMISAIALA